MLPLNETQKSGSRCESGCGKSYYRRPTGNLTEDSTSTQELPPRSVLSCQHSTLGSKLTLTKPTTFQGLILLQAVQEGCPGLSLYHKLTNCHSGLFTNYFRPQPFIQTLGLTIHMVVRILRNGRSPVPEVTEQEVCPTSSVRTHSLSSAFSKYTRSLQLGFNPFLQQVKKIYIYTYIFLFLIYFY